MRQLMGDLTVTRLRGGIVLFLAVAVPVLIAGCSGMLDDLIPPDGEEAPVPLEIPPNQVVTAYWNQTQTTFVVTPKTLIARGGTPGVACYTWSQPSGSTKRIPAGCTVAPHTGVFQGSGSQLVAPGTYFFLIQVSDGSRTAQGMITLQVQTEEIIPTAEFQQFMGLGNWRLADAQANEPYGHSLVALGGTPPYTWTEDTSYAGRGDFDLSGLVIDEARGIVRGTVMQSAAGETLRFRVVVKDSTGATALTDGLTYEIVVN